MKSLVILCACFVLLVGAALYWTDVSAGEPATVQITLTIPQAALPRITAAMKGLYPIPMVEDPENPGQQIPQYTDNQWAKQCVMSFVRRSVRRYEQRLSDIEHAVEEDPDIIE